MSAILREKNEAPVLTNEAIEVHLSYLRAGLDAVAEKVDSKIEVLSDKLARIDAVATSLGEQIKGTNARIEAVNTSLSEKIEKAHQERIAGDAALSEKIDALNTSLSEKIDKANQERTAGDAALGQKIDNLSERVSEGREDIAKLQGYVKALVWVLSAGSTIGLAVWIAKTLNWI